TSEIIIKIISETLSTLGMRLSKGKTKFHEDIIYNSIKKDKLSWKLKHNSNMSLFDSLMAVKDFSMEHQNSGTIIKEMTRIYKRIYGWQKEHFKKDFEIFIAITCDIAIHNPSAFPACAALLSKFLSFLDDTETKKNINDIIEKLGNISYTGYIEVWLQRVTIKQNIKYLFNDELCKLNNSKTHNIWNSDWLHSKLRNKIKSTNFFDQNIISKLDNVINPNEISMFLINKSSV
ncbi:hypothetical protein KC669_04275, partial [Candidatus Dojkabacteria bacterium]|nr:hypothetical protein [Candidatus Dojkabacteria bacterium]